MFCHLYTIAEGAKLSERSNNKRTDIYFSLLSSEVRSDVFFVGNMTRSVFRPAFLGKHRSSASPRENREREAHHCLTGSSDIIDIDRSSVSPDPLKIIEQPVFFREYMNNDITVINKHPAAVTAALGTL